MADTKRIEEEAVDAVKRVIRTVDLLSTFISDNDKGPCWDGYIAVHKDSTKSKDGIRRVHVQVKGTEQDDFTSDEISFLTSIADLEAYREEGGVIYFVVYERYVERELFPQTKIYYQELLPYKIYEILNRKKRKDQKEITVVYKEFPSNPDQIMTIFLQFLENRTNQSAFSGQSIPDIKKILQEHERFEIPITVFTHDTEDPISAFLRSDSYIYVRSDDLKTLFPVGTIGKETEITQTIPSNITVDGKAYYDHIAIIKKRKSVRIRIGQSIVIEEKDAQLAIQYRPAVYMRQFIRDHEFIYAVISSKGFEVNCNRIGFDDDQLMHFQSLLAIDIKELQSYSCILSMMKLTGCPMESDGSVDINISKLTNQDSKYLDILCQAFVENKTITGIVLPDVPFICFEITNKKIVVEIKKIGDGYKLGISNSCDWKFTATSPDGVETEIPLCFMYKQKEFVSVINIPFEQFMPMLLSVPQNSNLYGYANALTLDMITAYDMTNGIRKRQLYNTALEIIDWLNTLSDKKGEWDTRISILNKYQLIKRVRKLSQDEMIEIENIIDESDDSNEIRFGGYLLLDKQRRARVFYDKMSIQAKKEFMKLPICKFWRRK